MIVVLIIIIMVPFWRNVCVSGGVLDEYDTKPRVCLDSLKGVKPPGVRHHKTDFLNRRFRTGRADGQTPGSSDVAMWCQPTGQLSLNTFEESLAEDSSTFFMKMKTSVSSAHRRFLGKLFLGLRYR